jgi:nicotinamidase-related amidase
MLLDAQPFPIEIEPTRTALLITDMQRDFLEHRGLRPCRPGQTPDPPPSRVPPASPARIPTVPRTTRTYD